jgi:5-methylthioadenosine/S-adenosylhomocysteine deaminase
MSLTLLHDALILTLDTESQVIDGGYVLVRDHSIAEVGEGAYAGDENPDLRIDCRNRLIAPGLVNAHTHSQSSTMSGFGDRLSHPAFMWLTQAHTSRRTPDEIRLSVLLTAYGMMTGGTTAAIDHFPGQRFTLTDMDAVLSAWSETGMRVALGMRFFDGSFSDIFPAAPLPEMLKVRMGQIELLKPQPIAELSDLMDATIRKWHRRLRLSVFPAPSNPDRCSDKALLLCAELAERHDTGIHTHLLETKKQAELAQTRYRTTMVRHLEELGVLSDRWSCALLQRRVPLALGTDGSGANDNLIMHEAMRAVAVAHRSTQADRSRWITADDVLHMATTGGAGALRHDRLGRIAPGFVADLVVYRLDAPWWVPVNDVVNQMVFAENGASVETVMIDGRIVVENGVVTTFDVPALLAEVRSMSNSLKQRNADLFAVAHDIAELVP